MDAHRRGVAAATIGAMREVKPKRPFSIVRRLSVMVMCASLASLLLHLASLFVFMKPLLDETWSRMVSQVHTVETAVAPKRRDALAAAMLAGREQLRRIEEPPSMSIELRGVIRSFNALVGAVQSAERSRHDLFAGISHDLRTPLARLQLRAETECSDEVAARMEPDLLALSRIVDQFLA